MKTSHNSKTCEVCKRIIEATDKTLRDEFAMAALIPLVGVSLDQDGDESYRHKVLISNIGKAYQIADAMLEALKAKVE